MPKKVLILLLLMSLISGCIEAGSLNLPSEKTKIDLSSISAQLRKSEKTPSSGELVVPLKSLPRQYLRSAEHGMYSEAFSLEGLPSTNIVWQVQRDPYSREYKKIESTSTGSYELTIDSTNITVTETDNTNHYIIAVHIGLYTFSAETKDPGEIDSAKVYGTHEEVVMKVFEAGIKNALSFDLYSFGD